MFRNGAGGSGGSGGRHGARNRISAFLRVTDANDAFEASGGCECPGCGRAGGSGLKIGADGGERREVVAFGDISERSRFGRRGVNRGNYQ